MPAVAPPPRRWLRTWSPKHASSHQDEFRRVRGGERREERGSRMTDAVPKSSKKPPQCWGKGRRCCGEGAACFVSRSNLSALSGTTARTVSRCATKKLGDLGIRLRTPFSLSSPLLSWLQPLTLSFPLSLSRPRPFLLVLLPPNPKVLFRLPPFLDSLRRFSCVPRTRVRGGAGITKYARAPRGSFAIITNIHDLHGHGRRRSAEREKKDGETASVS